MRRRRQSIQEDFLEYFRYRIPPMRPSSPPASSGEVGRGLGTRSGEALAHESARPSGGGHFIPDNPGIRLIVRDARGQTWSLLLQPDVGDSGGGVMPQDFPIDPNLLAMLMGEEGAASSSPSSTAASELGQAGAFYPAQGSAASHASQQSGPLWVRIPAGQPGQDLLQAIARLISPAGNLSQDGLKALLNSPQFHQLFQGAQLTQGASQMLSINMLVGVLIPPNLLAANPEMAKALLVAQGLPAGLIHSIPDRAVAGALHALLQTSQAVGQNPLHFLQAVASALTLAGTPAQEAQNLLLQLLGVAKNQGIALSGDMAVSPEMLKSLAAKMLASNNPQLLGLNQMVQESFGQGLAQIFNSFIRVFLGGAMMQGQQMWPQSVPNERMLAELGGLFGALGSKPNLGKEEKRRSRKQARKQIGIDDPAFQRVERKEDILDEKAPQGGEEFFEEEGEASLAEAESLKAELGSIFIKVDEP